MADKFRYKKLRPEDIAAFRDGMNREFERQRREKEMPEAPIDAKTGRPTKALNDPIAPRQERPSNRVTIHRMEHEGPGVHNVTLPRRGRLGDLRICDGETGRPLNIGPTSRSRSEFGTVEAALEHFRRVALNFDKLNGYSNEA